MTSTLTSKGQITIPKEIRVRLGLRKGDRLDFHFDSRGDVVLRCAQPRGVEALAGLLRRYARKRPVTIEEMDEAVRKRIARDYRRSVSR